MYSISSAFKKTEWKMLKIRFEFQKCNLQDLIYGFNGGKTIIDKKLDKYLRSLEKYTDSDGWPLYQRMGDYTNWTDDFFLDLYSNPNKISNAFKSKIDELLSIVENKGFEL